MAVKVYAVRVGDRYGLEYEDYLKSKIPNIEFMNDPKQDLILQWNKLHYFTLETDEPIVVIDIDIELHNDYEKLFDYPIQRGEFLTINPWWDPEKRACDINGGFYKFYPKDTKYIYEEFMKKPDYWREYYIKKRCKPGPVNGEENFVSEMVKRKLEMKFLPDSWVTTMHSDMEPEKISKLTSKYPGQYIFLGGKINPDIKLIHYNGAANLKKIV